jgi:hypothetical protein
MNLYFNFIFLEGSFNVKVVTSIFCELTASMISLWMRITVKDFTTFDCLNYGIISAVLASIMNLYCCEPR